MRTQGKNPIVVEMGNIFFRKMKASNEHREALLAFSDLIARSNKKCKLDVVLPGPKDFSLGWQNLKNWLEIMGAPALGGNLVNIKTDKPLFQDSIVLERDGRKFGFFGVMTNDFNTIKIGDLKFRIDDPFEYSKRAYQQLKSKADIIIAMVNLNDSEVSRLTEVVPELKYILRGNATGISGRRNKIVGNAVTMATPSRGKYMGVLSFIGKGDSLDFSDVTEKQNAERNIHVNQKRIDNLLKAAKVETIEQYKDSLSPEDPKLSRINRYISKLESYKRELEKFDSYENYFIVDRVLLDTKIKDDPEIKKAADEISKEWGDPGKIQRMPPNFKKKPFKGK